MMASLLKFAAGFISKEFLKDVLKDVLLEFALDRLEEFVNSTKNKYDDELMTTFREFLEDRED